MMRLVCVDQMQDLVALFARSPATLLGFASCVRSRCPPTSGCGPCRGSPPSDSGSNRGERLDHEGQLRRPWWEGHGRARGRAERAGRDLAVDGGVRIIAHLAPVSVHRCYLQEKGATPFRSRLAPFLRCGCLCSPTTSPAAARRRAARVCALQDSPGPHSPTRPLPEPVSAVALPLQQPSPHAQQTLVPSALPTGNPLL